jgi:hypothetical protein
VLIVLAIESIPDIVCSVQAMNSVLLYVMVLPYTTLLLFLLLPTSLIISTAVSTALENLVEGSLVCGYTYLLTVLVQTLSHKAWDNYMCLLQYFNITNIVFYIMPALWFSYDSQDKCPFFPL